MIEEAEWDRAVAVLRSAGEVVVGCHVDPDGDALGSLLGLAGALRRGGTRVWATWGAEDPKAPPIYGFLEGLETVVPPAEVPERPDVFVAVDCGDPSRLGTLAGHFAAAATTVNLDHHRSNPGFGTVNLVDPGAASSAELVYQLVRRMGATPDPAEATALYTGIVTDTGRFQYSSTSPTTLRVAADLREIGVDHERVATEIFESGSLAYLHVVGVVLSRARVEDGLVWSWLDTADLDAAGLSIDEAEGLIDAIRPVKESRFALLLKQRAEGGGYKGSLRSRGEVDVAQIAQALGGGGHRRAAGFTFDGAPDEAARAVLKLADG
ncbi:MAG: bifunctional oligoribonuclease/PAP phosphatase NrnA [Acidimicrobiia bacterium]|nr:bifunctional oligoribonuclease/PAP phosphatase NrnA [Acidimicrobiia bacterium]